jgi:hypothetical protein
MADNEKIIKVLFSELEAPLFLGDKLSSGQFATLMQPGQFISTNLQEQDSSDDMAIQYSVTNDVLDTSFVYKPLIFTIGETYKRIITDAYALPYKPLSSGDQTEIAAIQQWRRDNQADYELWENRYYDADQAYETELQSQHPDAGKLRRLRQKRDDAWNNWGPIKGQWDRKTSRLLYLVRPDPTTLWNEYATNLQGHTKSAPARQAYLETFFVPPVAQWNSASTSWGTFEKTISESSTISISRSTSWSAGISAGWGLWSFGASAGGSSQYQYDQSDASTIDVKFDYLRVRIDRSYMVPDVFGYKFWTWNKQFGFVYLSDGGNLAADPPVRPIGNMPFLPTHFIVVRNVELSASFSHSDRTFIASQISAGGSAGWGPFSISGSYSEANTEVRTNASFNGTTLQIAQPQIIAFVGTLLPKTPDPDLSLPWQDDAAFPPKDSKQLKWMEEVRKDDYQEATVQERSEARYQSQLERARASVVTWRDYERRRQKKGAPPFDDSESHRDGNSKPDAGDGN